MGKVKVVKASGEWLSMLRTLGDDATSTSGQEPLIPPSNDEELLTTFGPKTLVQHKSEMGVNRALVQRQQWGKAIKNHEKLKHLANLQSLNTQKACTFRSKALYENFKNSIGARETKSERQLEKAAVAAARHPQRPETAPSRILHRHTPLGQLESAVSDPPPPKKFDTVPMKAPSGKSMKAAAIRDQGNMWGEYNPSDGTENMFRPPVYEDRFLPTFHRHARQLRPNDVNTALGESMDLRPNSAIERDSIMAAAEAADHGAGKHGLDAGGGVSSGSGPYSRPGTSHEGAFEQHYGGGRPVYSAFGSAMGSPSISGRPSTRMSQVYGGRASVNGRPSTTGSPGRRNSVSPPKMGAWGRPSTTGSPGPRNSTALGRASVHSFANSRPTSQMSMRSSSQLDFARPPSQLGMPRAASMTVTKKPTRQSTTVVAFGACVNPRYSSVGKTFAGADLPGAFF